MHLSKAPRPDTCMETGRGTARRGPGGGRTGAGQPLGTASLWDEENILQVTVVVVTQLHTRTESHWPALSSARITSSVNHISVKLLYSTA